MSVVERQAVEPAGRDWAEIGLGLVAALALVGIGAAGIWAVVVLVSSSPERGTTVRCDPWSGTRPWLLFGFRVGCLTR
jgi:hypothetical protein